MIYDQFGMHDQDNKVIPSWEALRDVVGQLRRAKKSIAFTNGCFDLLHVGHLRSLRSAREKGDCLMVAINSDTSTRRYKGSGRPIVPDHERAEMLAGLACVDYVFIFDEPTVDRLLDEIRPDAYCKGTEYSVQMLPERDTVQRIGTAFYAVGDPKDHSTADLIEKVVTSHANRPGSVGAQT